MRLRVIFTWTAILFVCGLLIMAGIIWGVPWLKVAAASLGLDRTKVLFFAFAVIFLAAAIPAMLIQRRSK